MLWPKMRCMHELRSMKNHASREVPDDWHASVVMHCMTQEMVCMGVQYAMNLVVHSDSMMQ